MSLRPKIPQQTVISAGDMSQATITSTVTILGGCSAWVYEFVWTGTSPVGTLQIQASNSYTVDGAGNVKNAGTWTPLYFLVNGSTTPANSIAVSGNSGSAYVSCADKPFAVRALYTKTSGTGTLTAIINAGVV